MDITVFIYYICITKQLITIKTKNMKTLILSASLVFVSFALIIQVSFIICDFMGLNSNPIFSSLF